MNWILMVLMMLPQLFPVAQRGVQVAQQIAVAQPVVQQVMRPISEPAIPPHVRSDGRYYTFQQGRWFVWVPVPGGWTWAAL